MSGTRWCTLVIVAGVGCVACTPATDLNPLDGSDDGPPNRFEGGVGVGDLGAFIDIAAVEMAHSPDGSVHDLAPSGDVGTPDMVAPPSRPIAFLAARDFPASNTPLTMVLGDIDGDGKVDVVLGGDLTTLLGKGDATLSARKISSYEFGGLSLAMMDVNGDAKPDLAAADSGIGVSVAINTGGGTFAPPATYVISTLIYSVALGDLNGDGKADLVALGTGQVFVLLNEGTGTFAAPVRYAVPTTGDGVVAIGDITGDGKADLVIAGQTNVVSKSITVLPGRGDGTVGVGVIGPGPVVTTSIALGDFNGDGKLDAAVTGGQGNSVVSVLLNQGNALGQPTHYTVSAGSQFPGSIVVGDINGDGKLDIGIVHPQSGFGLLINDGSGKFTVMSPSLTHHAQAIGLADLDGDGRLDIAIADSTLSTTDGPADVSILRNQGKGVFATAAQAPAGPQPSSVAIADLNGDGRPDVVMPNLGGNTMDVLLNQGNGVLGAPVSYVAGNNSPAVALGDLDGDGHPDVAIANQNGNAASVLLNRGDGTFAAQVNYSAGTMPVAIAIGDVDGDGKADLVLAGSASSDVSVLRNVGGGRFATAVKYAVGMTPGALVLSDLDGNGSIDIAVSESQAGLLSLLLNQGTGMFGAAVTLSLMSPQGGPGDNPSALAIGDVDGDGKPDIVATVHYNQVHPPHAEIDVLLNVGNARFAAPIRQTLDFEPDALVLGDLDGDGRRDLAFSSYRAGNVGLMVNTGGGAFAAPIYYSAGHAAMSLALADMNADHQLDVVVAVSSGACSVLINTTH